MPQYIAIRVPEIPAVGELMNGAVLRFNAVDEADALQQAAARLKEGSDAAIYGVTLASNITRRVVTGQHSYTVT